MNNRDNHRAQKQIDVDHKTRKGDHIALTENAQIQAAMQDTRFYYEPLLSGNRIGDNWEKKINFLGKELNFPLWISSMTGGTELAAKINTNMAKACKEFGLGMGLGSCRQILKDQSRFSDFYMRPICGDSVPLFANIGIGQLENLILDNDLSLLQKLVDRLDVDGLIIHINPLQEYIQPEGDLYEFAPIESLSRLFNFLGDDKLKIIVKEVGQGMGPKSLSSLFSLPISAFEFASFGGTNFSKIEQLRDENEVSSEMKSPFIYQGHTAHEMVHYINKLYEKGVNIPEIIISGGIRNSVDAYYLRSICKAKNIYGLASRVLNHATENYSRLEEFLSLEIETYRLCEKLLIAKELEE